MKFESKTFYSKPVVEIAEETPADVLDQEIEQAQAALYELERQAEIQRKADSLATLQEAKKRQEAKAEAEIILSQAVQMTKESSEANKAKIADWQEKFRELATLYRELSSEYSEIQKSLFGVGLKLKNAVSYAGQLEPSPENGSVTGPQDVPIRFARLLNKTGMTNPDLDIYPANMTTAETKLFSLLADDRPGARFKPQLADKNFNLFNF